MTVLRLSLVVGNSEVSSPKFEQLMIEIPQKKALTKMGGRANRGKNESEKCKKPRVGGFISRV